MAVLNRITQYLERQEAWQTQGFAYQLFNNQQKNNHIAEDMALERFQKFGLPKFAKEPNPNQA